MSITASTASTDSLVSAGGVFDIINGVAADAEASLKIVAVVLAIFFVLSVMVSTKMRLVPVILSGVTAGVALWIVFNVVDLREVADSTITDARATATVQLAGSGDSDGSGGVDVGRTETSGLVLVA